MKEKLAQLIEAYAAARGAGNPMLLEFAAGELSGFLNKVEITEAKQEVIENEE